MTKTENNIPPVETKHLLKDARKIEKMPMTTPAQIEAKIIKAKKLEVEVNQAFYQVIEMFNLIKEQKDEITEALENSTAQAKQMAITSVSGVTGVTKTTIHKFEYDDAKIVKSAHYDKFKKIVTKESIDKAKLKQFVKDTGKKVAGFKTWKETSTKLDMSKLLTKHGLE